MNAEQLKNSILQRAIEGKLVEQREEIEEDGCPKAKKYTAQEIVEVGYNLDLCGFPHEEEEILEPFELITRYKEKRTALNAEIDDVLGRIEELLACGRDTGK